MQQRNNYRTSVFPKVKPDTGMDMVGPLPTVQPRSSRRVQFSRPFNLAAATTSASASTSKSGTTSGSGSTSGVKSTSGGGSSSSTTTKVDSSTTTRPSGKAADRDADDDGRNVAKQQLQEQQAAGRTHLYEDGARRGYFQGSYEDQAPVPKVRFAEHQYSKATDQTQPRFLLTRKPRMIKSDMAEDLLDYVVQTTQASLDRYRDDIDISRCIKMKLENRFQGCWVVIVGANYATFVTEDCFQPGTFSYFFIGKQGFLVFKCF